MEGKLLQEVLKTLIPKDNSFIKIIQGKKKHQNPTTKSSEIEITIDPIADKRSLKKTKTRRRRRGEQIFIIE